VSQSPAILITYHNEGELLRRCLASLASQTRPVREVLIYDDASDVRPGDHLPAGLPVRVLRGERNIGPARARNVLLGETTAAFVHFHDADDAFAPDWNARVSAEIASGDIDAVFTEVSSVTETGVVHEDVLELSRLAAGAGLVSFCIQGSMLVPAGSYRRSVVTAIGGYRESLWQSEDWDFHIRLAAASPVYRVIPQSLVRIHLRAESRSRDVADVWRSAVQATRLLASELPAAWRGELAEAAAKAGSRLYRAGAAEDAREAFQLARELGNPVHSGQPGVYRTVARHAGQEWAERISRAYRKWLPERVRGRLAQWKSS
jgi:glycosyltransferase involved in cell wall biosynthesis